MQCRYHSDQEPRCSTAISTLRREKGVEKLVVGGKAFNPYRVAGRGTRTTEQWRPHQPGPSARAWGERRAATRGSPDVVLRRGHTQTRTRTRAEKESSERAREREREREREHSERRARKLPRQGMKENEEKKAVVVPEGAGARAKQATTLEKRVRESSGVSSSSGECASGESRATAEYSKRREEPAEEGGGGGSKPGDGAGGAGGTAPTAPEGGAKSKPKLPRPSGTVECPRCNSQDTKFCY